MMTYLEINMKLEITTLDQMHEHWLDYVDNVLSTIEAMKLMHPDETAYHVLEQVKKEVLDLPYSTDTEYFIEYDD